MTLEGSKPSVVLTIEEVKRAILWAYGPAWVGVDGKLKDSDIQVLTDRLNIELRTPARQPSPQDTVLREAAEALLCKLDQVEKDTAGIFVMAHVGGAKLR
jgi:hypothetical protein